MLYTFLQSNHIQFSFQLLVSEFVFLIDRPRRSRFGLRLSFGLLFYLILAKTWGMMINTLDVEALFPYVLLYFGYMALTAVLIFFCYDIRLIQLCFIVTGGYATEHMGFALSRILLYLLHVSYLLYGSLLHLAITRYFIYIVTAALVYCVIIRKNRDTNYLFHCDRRIVVLFLLMILTAIGLSVYWSYPEEYALTSIGGILFPAYSFLCSAFVLLMEYYVLRENSMKQEKEMMDQLIKMSDAQQKSAKEAIDIINIKCHDLKHQIGALAKMDDPLARSKYLQEVSEAVSIYDAVYHTGNKALDYILREKTLLFNEYQVKFSCMAEGGILSFMVPADIYALMGNALDNALECVLRGAGEERVISLHIKGRGKMALIHLENRCSHEPQFQDGLPVTDKEDKARHGFGVRSIRYITEKYHGELFMYAKNGGFFLDILLPQST